VSGLGVTPLSLVVAALDALEDGEIPLACAILHELWNLLELEGHRRKAA